MEFGLNETVTNIPLFRMYSGMTGNDVAGLHVRVREAAVSVRATVQAVRQAGRTDQHHRTQQRTLRQVHSAKSRPSRDAVLQVHVSARS